jgi:hypothetical protein
VHRVAGLARPMEMGRVVHGRGRWPCGPWCGSFILFVVLEMLLSYG